MKRLKKVFRVNLKTDRNGDFHDAGGNVLICKWCRTPLKLTPDKTPILACPECADFLFPEELN